MNCNQPNPDITYPDNSSIECDSQISDKCVVRSEAIAYLQIPANSSQSQVTDALVLALINTNQNVSSSTFTRTSLNINGTYNIQASDDKKYISIDSIQNTPRIALASALPDGFECYFINNTPSLDGFSLSDVLGVVYEFDTPPLFTVPRSISIYDDVPYIVKPYGMLHVVKQNSNLYVVTGDLVNFPS